MKVPTLIPLLGVIVLTLSPARTFAQTPTTVSPNVYYKDLTENDVFSLDSIPVEAYYTSTNSVVAPASVSWTIQTNASGSTPAWVSMAGHKLTFSGPTGTMSAAAVQLVPSFGGVSSSTPLTLNVFQSSPASTSLSALVTAFANDNVINYSRQALSATGNTSGWEADSGQLHPSRGLRLDGYVWPSTTNSAATIVAKDFTYFMGLDSSNHVTGGVWVNGNYPSGGYQTITSTATLPTTTYSHVAVAYNSRTKVLEVDINGAQDKAATLSGLTTYGIAQNSNKVWVASQDGTSSFLNGYLDELAIMGEDNKVVAHWAFNTNNTGTDSAGYNGTLLAPYALALTNASVTSNAVNHDYETHYDDASLEAFGLGPDVLNAADILQASDPSSATASKVANVIVDEWNKTLERRDDKRNAPDYNGVLYPMFRNTRSALAANTFYASDNTPALLFQSVTLGGTGTFSTASADGNLDNDTITVAITPTGTTSTPYRVDLTSNISDSLLPNSETFNVGVDPANSSTYVENVINANSKLVRVHDFKRSAGAVWQTVVPTCLIPAGVHDKLNEWSLLQGFSEFAFVVLNNATLSATYGTTASNMVAEIEKSLAVEENSPGVVYVDLPFDEGAGTATTSEVSGANSTSAVATLVGSPTWVGGYEGAFGMDRFVTANSSNANMALSFNGTSQYVKMPASTATAPLNNDLCFEAWVNQTTTNSSPAALAARANNWEIGLQNGKLYSLFNLSNGWTTTISGTVPIPAGTFSHVLVTLNAQDSKVHYFVNGIEDTTASTAVTGVLNATSSAEVDIGASGASHYFNGAIDNVKIGDVNWYKVGQGGFEIETKGDPTWDDGTVMQNNAEAMLGITYIYMSKAAALLGDSTKSLLYNNYAAGIANHFKDNFIVQRVNGSIPNSGYATFDYWPLDDSSDQRGLLGDNHAGFTNSWAHQISYNSYVSPSELQPDDSGHLVPELQFLTRAARYNVVAAGSVSPVADADCAALGRAMRDINTATLSGGTYLPSKIQGDGSVKGGYYFYPTSSFGDSYGYYGVNSLLATHLSGVLGIARNAYDVNTADNTTYLADLSQYYMRIVNHASGLTASGSSTIVSPGYITDGDSSNTANFATVGTGAQWMQLDLGSAYDLNQIQLWHYYGDGRSYNSVVVQVSNDPSFGTGHFTTVFNNDSGNALGFGVGYDATYAETSAGKTIMFDPIYARYVRFWSNGNSVNTANHYVEAQVYGWNHNPSNVALGKPVIFSSSSWATSSTLATDGQYDYSDSANLASGGVQNIVLDLGQVYYADQINLWHYFKDTRTYSAVVVQYSTDDATWHTVFNNDTANADGQGVGTDATYQETSTGKTISFARDYMRYIRLWADGNTQNSGSHYTEVQVVQ